MFQSSWELRGPNLHLTHKRKFPSLRSVRRVSGGSHACRTAVRGNSGRPDLGLKPMSATSWLWDCLGYLLPHNKPCQTCGLKLQESAQDFSLGRGQ